MRESLKDEHDLLEPDPLMMRMLVHKVTGERIPKEIKHVRSQIASLTLHPEVPDEVASHFVTALHLYVYSWFVYRFQTVAIGQGLASLEYGLRFKYGVQHTDRAPTLKPLLRRACADGLIRDDLFQQWKVIFPKGSNQPGSPWFRHRLLPALTLLRNTLAHGHFTVMPEYGILSDIRDILNQLFPTKPGCDNQ